MDQKITEYLDRLIEDRLNNSIFNSLNEQQKSEAKESLRGTLYKAIVEELINVLNEEQLNQIADLDFTSSDMEAKLEEFAATIPNFLSVVEDRLHRELANFQPPTMYK